MAYHAVLSPSGADRWMQCPGSVVLSEGLPDSGSEYADEGTAAHFLASECLGKTHHELHPANYLGRAIAVSPDATWLADTDNLQDLIATGVRVYEVDEDMVGHVNRYVQFVRQQALGGTLLAEQQVDISPFTREEGATGTADAIVITADGELQIHDLKYGQGKRVAAEYNRQLLLYAAGAAEQYGLAYEFDRVQLFIHQPRVALAPSAWVVPGGDYLADFGRDVTKAAMAVALAKQELRDEHLNPVESACLWCRAKAQCPALAAKIAATVLEDFATIEDITPETIREELKFLDTAESAVLGRKMAAIPLIEMWAKAVRGKVEADLLAGVPVQGYKLVRGKQGNRQWNDKDEAEAALKACRLKVDEMYDLSLISPTSAEKLTKRLDEKGKPVLGPRQWKKVETLIVRKEGGLSVAPESDPRPAEAVPKATVEDFSDVPDDLEGDLV